MKYIHFDKRYNTYVLNKKIFGKSYNFGSYESLESARDARDYFEKEGWVNCMHNRLQFTKTKNIEKWGDKWVIVKQIDGVKSTFGRFDNYADAVIERNLLRECEWDFEAMSTIDERKEDTTEWLPKKLKNVGVF